VNGGGAYAASAGGAVRLPEIVKALVLIERGDLKIESSNNIWS